MNSSESLKIIRDILPISQEQLASILHVSPSTVDRWINTKTGPSKADQKERLARLREIVELGIKVYTPEGLQKYLSTPLSEFRYQTAYKLIQSDDFDSVMSALQRMIMPRHRNYLRKP